MATNVQTILKTVSLILQGTPLSLIDYGVRLGLFVSELRRPPDWETIKAQIGGLKAEATIATFLAAVQSQIVALSYENNSSAIEVVTNALGFAGVLFSVVAACLALLASTITQRHIHIVESQLSIIDDLPIESIETVIGQIMALGPLSQFTYLGVFRRAMLKCEARLAAARPRQDIEAYRIHADFDVGMIIASCEHIQGVTYIGDAAGTAMLLGIICFLASILCLAISTQPPAVWIVSAVACSSIIILPMVNRALGILLKMRLPSIFDF
ncbi:hypothetical protein BDZ94DRAFT_292217 [Collybia nuda]|uniref:Transmembrane protein n=1 Tax=Collybia nuda TaxID=64659 RepID=A0A9P6CDG2_9AGAR|nr:hypothetical protein BDZ94DRAFT_292217 [Collybia nuda]